MFDLTRQDIVRICANESVFRRGLRYFRQGTIRELHCSEETGRVEALVQGTKKYRVGLLKEGRTISFHCTCPAFASYKGFCKHVIAVLLALSEQNPAEKQKTSDAALLGNLLDEYAGTLAGEIKRREVELELSLTLSRRGSRPGSYSFMASLNIGETGARKYVVRNIETLVSAVARGSTLHFGKQFTYDPARHYFSPGSGGLLDFFMRIHEIETGDNMYLPGGALRGKEVSLTAGLFRRLLAGLEEKPFTLNLNSATFDRIRQTTAGLPLCFSLQDSDAGLILRMDARDRIEPLTRECDIILYEGQIYNLIGTPQEALIPLLRTMKGASRGELQIQGAQEQRFLSELYPIIERYAALKPDPAVQKRLCRPSLEAEVYLDYEEGAVAARLEFIYGEARINPFSPVQSKKKDAAKKERLLIRDSAAERQVMRFFEESEFRVMGRAMYLDGEDKIWPFVYETIPELQQHASVYYSERFKQAGRRAPRFTGKAGIDWKLDLLELELSLEGVDPAELAEVWHSLRIKRRYHRLRDGSVLPLEGEGIEQFSRLTGALELQPGDLKGQTVRLPKYQALYLDGLINEYNVASIRESEDLAALIRRVRSPGAGNHDVPPPLQGVLRGYQATGFRWLKSLACCGFGGILADDMGLGKTVQAIAFILSERLENPSLPPALVVAPASLIYNWEAEIEKFAPRLKTVVIAGTKKERRELLPRKGGADVVITSYPLLRRDIADYTPLQFSSCFLDEAQYIKNPGSLTAQCVRRIKAPQRFALTGTPMENSLIELWSIFQFIMPGYLQSQKKFIQKYGGAAADPGRPEKGALPLSVKIRPFILRRLKGEVLTELPPKIEHRYLSDLTPDQRRLYLAYLERLRGEAAEALHNNGFNRSRIQILAGLMRLRQICCHPSLFVENYRGESAKLLQLQELLREAVDGGHRILLFSQFTGMLQLIKGTLDKGGYSYFYLDGATKTGERLQMANAFNSGEGDIFLISLKAGGTGLNLTGADIVIQYDLWWNPAVEEQAAGRAHRIGQKKIVQVIRMLARGTIEEKIFDLQQRKKELIDRVIQPGETFLSSMDESDIRVILEL